MKSTLDIATGIATRVSMRSFVQDLCTMIRYKLNPIILLINNGGYTIEVGNTLECHSALATEQLGDGYQV